MKIGKTIYCDYQATTPLDPKVISVMYEYLQNNFANPHSKDHYLGWQASNKIKKSKNSISEILEIDTNELFFTSGATESNNMIIQGLARHKMQEGKVRILSTPLEHKSVLSVLKYLEQNSEIDVEYVKVDCKGTIDLKNLEHLLRTPTSLVSIISVNNEIGTIQPIKEIYKLVKAHETILHCDATQALCSGLHITELAQYTDAFSFSGHKIYGPKGIGGLYINKNIQKIITPLLFGGSQQNGMRSGTLSPSLITGLGMAVKLLDSSNTENIEIQKLTKYFWENVKNIYPEAIINGPDFSNRHCGNLNICLPGINNKELINSLQPFVAASTGSACNSENVVSSHVLEAIGLTEERAKSSIRFSFGRFSTKEQIDEIIQILQEKIEDLVNL